MNIDKNSLSSSELAPAELSDALATNAEHLDRIANEIYDLADRDRTDPLALLQLLRTLEHLHREIQQDYFQSALPNSRQALYTLLRDIEENGGWPYIQRWKLQALFANLAKTEK
ncbi:hypothetical protein [Chamaesiphon sp. VAR_48_metabat_135_sub]|uniref:hypothetical protein n=1 Tax=Chamaesiphon sp. VAR_48_metabat_135_sub TaxID=2964699 RepID=UPI00286C9790|nr:hypothetical protein [Chamaesiphon sp. VAR_48_metabat_135_sub]